jgi:hypothetical protein
MKTINPRRALIFIISLVGIAMLIHNTGGREAKGRTHIPISNEGIQLTPNERIVTIVTNEWRGITCAEDGARIECYILTRNVRWRCRVDPDDPEGILLPGIDGKGGSEHAELPRSNILQAKLEPGQGRESAKVLFKVCKAKGN